jgi:hypothetical protein
LSVVVIRQRGDMQRRGGSERSATVRRDGPKARKAPPAHASTADLQEQLDRRTRELEEALQHQTAQNRTEKRIKVARARRVFIERIIRKSESVRERTVLILSLLTVERRPLLFVPSCYQCVTISHRRITKHLLGNKHGRAAASHYTVMPELQDTDGACVR